ncbi:15894_t:CDS:1, partial [Racocetra persica]
YGINEISHLYYTLKRENNMNKHIYKSLSKESSLYSTDLKTAPHYTIQYANKRYNSSAN